MLWFLATYYLLGMLGANLGYHRMLAHHAVSLTPLLARTCVLLGLPAGTPVQWAGNHRYHHTHADTHLDPHSPGRQGFWYAHCGWYYGLRFWPLAALYALAGPLRLLVDAWLRPRTGLSHNHLAADVAANPFYRRVSAPTAYGLLLHLHFLAGVGIPYWLWGGPGLALSWAMWVALYNLGDAIDSLAHDAEGPVSRTWLALLTAGEGWHCEHHRHPGSARCGIEAGQFDLTWNIILLLERAGWAKVEQEHAGSRTI